MAGDNKLEAEVLTPEGEVFSGELQQVSTKTTVGEIGILANHIPTIAGAGGNGVIVVGGRDKLREVWNLPDATELALDLKRITGDDGLHLVRCSEIAGEQDFFGEHETRGFEPIVESTE